MAALVAAPWIPNLKANTRRWLPIRIRRKQNTPQPNDRRQTCSAPSHVEFEARAREGELSQGSVLAAAARRARMARARHTRPSTPRRARNPPKGRILIRRHTSTPTRTLRHPPHRASKTNVRVDDKKTDFAGRKDTPLPTKTWANDAKSKAQCTIAFAALRALAIVRGERIATKSRSHARAAPAHPLSLRTGDETRSHRPQHEGTSCRQLWAGAPETRVLYGFAGCALGPTRLQARARPARQWQYAPGSPGTQVQKRRCH